MMVTYVPPTTEPRAAVTEWMVAAAAARRSAAATTQRAALRMAQTRRGWGVGGELGVRSRVDETENESVVEARIDRACSE